MLFNQSLRAARATRSPRYSLYFVGPILCACAGVIALSQSSTVYAALSSNCGAIAEVRRSIEADFYACVLKGLTHGSEVASVEDQCALEYIAALDLDQIADEDDVTLRTEIENDSFWVEY